MSFSSIRYGIATLPAEHALSIRRSRLHSPTCSCPLSGAAASIWTALIWRSFRI